MGDLHRDPICTECGCRHSPIGDCTPLMTRAVDDPNDPAYQPKGELMCKGSLALGTGCGKCSRCREEQAEMIRPSTILKRELATRWAWSEIDGRICVGMEGNLDTIHDATLIVSGGFLRTYEGDDGARLLAQHLVDQHNKEIAV